MENISSVQHLKFSIIKMLNYALAWLEYVPNLFILLVILSYVKNSDKGCMKFQVICEVDSPWIYPKTYSREE